MTDTNAGYTTDDLRNLYLAHCHGRSLDDSPVPPEVRERFLANCADIEARGLVVWMPE